MDAILQSLRETEGVRGAFLFDPNGRVLALSSHSAYNKPLLDDTSQRLVKAIESYQVQQDDWDSMVISYTEGKLILKNIKVCYLAIIADQAINVSFANVAIRIAETKIKKLTEMGGALSNLSSSSANTSDAKTTEKPNSGSGSGAAANSRGQGGASSGVTTPGGAAMDEASANFLARCTSALARTVGPMSKVFVAESVSKLCADSPFSMKDSSRLLEELKVHFDNRNEFEKFKEGLLHRA